MEKLCCCKGKAKAGGGVVPLEFDDGISNDIANHKLGNMKTKKKVVKVKGTVVLVKKYLLDHYTDVLAYALDRAWEILGRRVTIQLISSNQEELGKEARLEKWALLPISLTSEDCQLSVTFDWDESMGVPGAFIIKNRHRREFFLKTVTLENVPGVDRVHFVCHSWVYPVGCYNYDRVFFSNKTYLPSETPEPLRKYREQELVNLRGNGEGRLEEWDRTYDYAYYNDLGNPDKGPDHARPILGGSEEYPYPRRGRTGREPTKTDPNCESRLPIARGLNIHVPKDERFSQKKLSYAFSNGLKSIMQVLDSESSSIFGDQKNFDSFEEIMKIYNGGIESPSGPEQEFLEALHRDDGERGFKFPVPFVIKEDKSAWRTDEEFGREMLAGTNPVIISRLHEFPPSSKLDPREYGNQKSTITEQDIKENMNGLTVDEAIRRSRLFILNYHDALMPYLRRINSTNTKTYATRTILLLQDDGTLKPLAIELSLPHPLGDSHGAVSKVFTPTESGVRGSLWQLAKAYAAVNDSGYHQLISHWLHTHASMEPFVIATHRQLSVLHPIHKLLHPHFRDTMYINALSRQLLICDTGLLEQTVFPSRYSMEMSAAIYKDWVFTDQALPADLLKRGVAVHDPTQPHGLKLLIQDYPYAVDGLEIWFAIEKWVEEYCTFYYPSDDLVQDDNELQSWWTEIRNVGHGDKKHEPWWVKMDTRADLIQTCTIIIWTASALHAAINFGQYPYGGYAPNRPAISRRFMPEPGTCEYAELETNPDATFLKTITARLQTLIGVTLIELLSGHSTDEVYLGQSEFPEWTSDAEALEAFEKFGKRLVEIEKKIMEMNKEARWKNRVGPVKLPYTLLYPNTSDLSGKGGLNGKGIPNSVSI